MKNPCSLLVIPLPTWSDKNQIKTSSFLYVPGMHFLARHLAFGVRDDRFFTPDAHPDKKIYFNSLLQSGFLVLKKPPDGSFFTFLSISADSDQKFHLLGEVCLLIQNSS
jgi:hypothetical protein